MGSRSRVLQLHSKSFSLFYLFPCLSSTQLRFKSVTTRTPSPTNSRVHRMATEASSSPSSVTSAKEIADLWVEYEENSSSEAKIVKDFDKVEMILQALEYENEQGRDLDEFFQSTAGEFLAGLAKNVLLQAQK